MPDFNYKLILIGDSTVGKTSIINRFVNGEFNDNEASSINVQIQRKIVKLDAQKDKWAQLHIWDTLGQEQFKAISPLFFRKSVGALLVYDSTNKQSFDNLEEWYQQLTSCLDTRVVVMLVGNKCDLNNRQVQYNTAMEYARSHNFGFLEVSAKTGVNIKNAYYSLVKGIYLSISLIICLEIYRM